MMHGAIVAENLRRLRLAKPMSQAEVAEKANLSRVGYRNIESGHAEPRVDTLQRIAQALGTRVSDLLAPVTPLRHVRFRARKRLVTYEAILADVSRWLRNFNELEKLLGERHRFKLAALSKSAGRRPAGARARLAAQAARKHLKVHDTALIRDICGLLDDRGGIKVYTPAVASDQFFGLCVGGGDGGPAIVVNTWHRISVERWIFSAAHELGHLLMHPGAFDVTKRIENDPEEEHEADEFAGHFLMPDPMFRGEWEDSRGLGIVDRVLKVKRVFRVSWKAVMHRVTTGMPDAGPVWAKFYAAYKRQYGKSLSAKEEPDGAPPSHFQSGRPPTRGEPADLTKHDFVEDRLGALVRMALERGEISMSRAAEILRLDLVHMRQLANDWVD